MLKFIRGPGIAMLTPMLLTACAAFAGGLGVTVTTLAGSGTPGSADGTGTAATFTTPHGVAVDGAGNLYVADSFSNLIHKITPADLVSTLAGSGASGSNDGIGTAASFNFPQGVAVDGAGNVYVSDAENSRIRKITQQ